jgi:hypothetical protein
VVPAALDRGRKSLRGLFRVTHLPEGSTTSSQRRNRRPARLREELLMGRRVDARRGAFHPLARGEGGHG